MRRAVLVASLALSACSATGGDRTADSPPAPAAGPVGEGPFAGVWQSCEGGATPGECSRYVLVQRGDRICGTWEYVATGDGYAGRVVARAVSATEARRTQVCGRPGSETRTECADGWDRIDKPLWLCDGMLSDLDAADGACRAEYRRADAAADASTLSREPWMQSCLMRGPEAMR